MKIYTAHLVGRPHPFITVDPQVASVLQARGWTISETETSDTAVSKWPVWLFYSATVLGVISCLMWIYAKFGGLLQ